MERTVIATNLAVPWGFAFLPNGDALFTERDSGRLLRMDASGNVREVQTLPTSGYGEGGSLGLAVSPEYERDGYVYAYYTTGEDNRVVRFRLGEEPQPILTGIPFNTYHDGGRIAFGPDGKLYVATGDAATRRTPRTARPWVARSFAWSRMGAYQMTTPSRTAPSIPTDTATSRGSPGTGRAVSTPRSSGRTRSTRSTS